MPQKEADKFTDSNILEGMVSIRSLISARENHINDRKIEKILFDADKIKKKEREFAYLAKKAALHGFILEKSDHSTLEALTIGNSHGGIIAICTDRTLPPLSAQHIKPGGFYVMLEGIEDPYNFGYALRSVYAAGADGIILSPRNWMGAAGVVCRASAGASESAEIFIADGGDAVSVFKEKNYKIVCADKENAVSAYDADLRFPVFLIVGGEKRGISRALLDLADLIVKVEYGRDFPAALSTASAASILSYEIFRQNRK